MPSSVRIYKYLLEQIPTVFSRAQVYNQESNFSANDLLLNINEIFPSLPTIIQEHREPYNL